MSRVESTKEDAKEAWSWKAKKGTKSHVEPWVHVASTPCRISLTNVTHHLYMPILMLDNYKG